MPFQVVLEPSLGAPIHKFFFEKKGILKFSKKTENHDFQGGPGASEVRFQKKFKYYASRFGSSNGLRTSPRSFLGAPFGLNLSCERGVDSPNM